MKKIIITGGDGNFASYFKKRNSKFKFHFPSSKELNILSIRSISSYIKKIKPDYLIHNAAISRPMQIHENNITRSIDVNIIGTCNVVKICEENKIKLIYFSSSYVYGGKKSGSYKETDPLLPYNNYAWSKLGGECAVQMYDNSLILRLSVTQNPFQYSKAYKNVYASFIYHKDAADIILRLLEKKGIINIGGSKKSIFDFAKSSNNKVKPIYLNRKTLTPKNSSLDISKLKKILK